MNSSAQRKIGHVIRLGIDRNDVTQLGLKHAQQPVSSWRTLKRPLCLDQPAAPPRCVAAT